MPQTLRTERPEKSLRRGSLAATLVVTTAIAVSATGCRRNDAAAHDAPATSASAAPSAAARTKPLDLSNPATEVLDKLKGIPSRADEIAAIVNPGKKPVYKGPTGSVRGKVTVQGDPPPVRPGPMPSEKRCGKDSLAFNERQFRVGPSGGLADAVIGVTEYDAYIPQRGESVDVVIRDCTFDRRTVVLTYGQRIDVKNLDPRESYLPHLDGSRAPALMVATPKGDPVRLYPPSPGPFTLQDDLKHPWMAVPVLVFKYATFDVSAIDGSFKVEGLPVGKMKISMRHPQIPQTVEKELIIEEGKTTEMNFEVTYRTPPPAPSASAPASPAKPPTAKTPGNEIH